MPSRNAGGSRTREAGCMVASSLDEIWIMTLGILVTERLLPIGYKGETPFNRLLIEFEELFLALESSLHTFKSLLKG